MNMRTRFPTNLFRRECVPKQFAPFLPRFFHTQYLHKIAVKHSCVDPSTKRRITSVRCCSIICIWLLSSTKIRSQDFAFWFIPWNFSSTISFVVDCRIRFLSFVWDLLSVLRPNSYIDLYFLSDFNPSAANTDCIYGQF